MNHLVESITHHVALASATTLGHAVIGLALLVAAWLAVPLLTRLAGGLLERVQLVNPGAGGTLTSVIGVGLTLAAMAAVLAHFGLRVTFGDILASVRGTVDQVLAFVPLAIAAFVVLGASWTIARVASRLAGGALDAAAERIGNPDANLASYARPFTFAAVFFSLSVAALGVMNLTPLGAQASQAISELGGRVTSIVGAAGILLASYVVSRFGAGVFRRALERMGADALPEEMGVDGLFPASLTFSGLLTGTLMFFAMLAATAWSVAVLDIEMVSVLFERATEIGGWALYVALALVTGLVLGKLVNREMERGWSTPSVVRSVHPYRGEV